jgi:hypothetical protein
MITQSDPKKQMQGQSQPFNFEKKLLVVPASLAERLGS